jgi:hypothetical protein
MTRGFAFLSVGLLIVVASVLLFSALSEAGVDAAKGGNGKGKNGNGTDAGVCIATPNPVALGEMVTINGSEFPPETNLSYTISSAGAMGAGAVSSDSSGNFSISGGVAWLGTNTVTVSGGGTQATCTFEVF